MSHEDVGSQYDLFGTVHHKAKRGNNGHYTAVCKSQVSNVWYRYNDHQVYAETFVSKRSMRKMNPNVLKRLYRSGTMLFYVKKADVHEIPNKLLTINIEEDDNSSSSSSHTRESYINGYGSSDASRELNVAEKPPSTLKTFMQRRANLSQVFLQQNQGHYCSIC